MEKDIIYHLYNRGNNGQNIFFNPENYLFFLHKVRKHLYPNCDIIAYCLMPNHFHFMIQGNSDSEKMKKYGNSMLNAFSENLRIMLSSYTQAINKQENRTGSLFQQNTKIKSLSDIFYGRISKMGSIGYDYYCFHYIHDNPVQAGLVSKIEDWEFSSYRDYTGLRQGSLINKNLALHILSQDSEFYTEQIGLKKLIEKF